jgi:Uma2 family endonuclease
LEQGDHLSREEFERRYEAMPELKKAELIEGIVYMPSRVRWQQHAGPHADLIGWLGKYCAHSPGVAVGANGTLRLDMENEPQPDAAMIIEPARGGKVQLSPDDYIEGAPELVAEVSASTVSIDMNAKLRVYRRNSVKEYIVWRVLDRAIDWFILRQSQYDKLAADAATGVFRSEVFPGLWLDANAMINGDLARVLQVFDQGIASPQHAEFVANLAKAKPGIS